MKNKTIIIGILLVLLAISLILNGLLLLKKDSTYIQVSGEKITTTENSYECTLKNSTENEDFVETITHYINFDKIGNVIKLVDKHKWKYSDLVKYNEYVDLYKDDENGNYTFDEKNLIIITTAETDYTKASDNQNQNNNLWIKHVIDDYIENGFVCTLK